ncbi:pectate lyase family protein [Pedobacter cryophilus]|uniref:Pectate lyase n=1 Tax=Pedobacter cryophilus TaxID=2571271 RepID=A0A4U1BVM6_9SPHI|nr:hypothetical protein [Pedobacter cryophilus]TKB96257.1 hypothetical protein FA046_13800 [Pedobacter cryophilus]
MKKYLKLYAFLLFLPVELMAQQLAFPGALGRGRFASGGRGLEVFHVTNLNDTGEGSFRDAVSKPKRTVVFDVGGVINIKSKVQVASDITIAGQTAPGEGIVIYGDGVTLSGSKNVIMRYLRLRGSINMSRGTCTLIIDHAENMIFDHISVQWGRWDNLHIKESNNITLQHCIIGEAIDPQRFGALLEIPTNISIYNSLWIDNQSRNPKAKAKIEFVNNVVYNWGVTGFVGGHSSAHHYQDIINNYFIAGPNSNNSFIGQFSATDHVYHKGNFVDLNKNGVLDGIAVQDESFKSEKATLEEKPTVFNVDTKILTAQEAYLNVIKEVGCSLKRDAVDLRLLGYLKSLGKEGVIFKTEQASGGQGVIKAGKKIKDKDLDGMSDQWERRHQLNIKNVNDHQKITASGYSNLEEYLNNLVTAHQK